MVMLNAGKLLELQGSDPHLFIYRLKLLWRVRSTPIHLQVKTTVDIGSSVSNSVMIGQAIAKGTPSAQ